MQLLRERDFNIRQSHTALMKYVLYYNVVFPQADMFTEQYTLMPDACGTLSIAYDGKDILAELWGASATPTLLGGEPNQYQVMLLIQLSSYGLYQLTNFHQVEFVDKRIALRDIDQELSSSFCEALETACSITELFGMCDEILYPRMNDNIVSHGLLAATSKISDRHGHISVTELAKEVGYSDRQLNRLFLSQIGMNVKSYARLARFNYVLKYMQQSPCSFATLAQQAGYYDQSHFDKDFGALSGVSPKVYVEKMSDFYYDATEIFNTMGKKEG